MARSGSKDFKTKKELDEEDWERYRKKQDDIHERKRAKWEAEGFKCVIKGCDYNECQDHINKHQEYNMITRIYRVRIF